MKREGMRCVEFVSKDINRAKNFYAASFGWRFTDYGEHYAAFEGDFVDGGFTSRTPVNGTILIVLYSKDIESTRSKVISAGGVVVKDIFGFPGGKRFQFTDLDGYELAVWTE